MPGKEAADECKARGNAEFGKNTQEGYEAAIAAYKQAIEHFPEGHVYHANTGAAYLELAKMEWKSSAKLSLLANALMYCTRCTELAPDWPKGFVRKAAAEFELVSERAKYEKEKNRVKEDWEKEEEELAAAPEPDAALMALISGAAYASCEATCRAGLAGSEDQSSSQMLLLKSRLQSLRDAGHATDDAADKLLADSAASLVPKADGNAQFSAKRFEQAANKYTEALSLDPYNHVFYSNRSACYAELDQAENALRDAERCVGLCPTFAKGYSRKTTALYLLGRYPEAEAAAEAGLSVDSANAVLKDLLAKARVETSESPAVQEQMHKFRADKRRNDKMKAMLSGLNLGPNVQMFNGANFGGGGAGDLASLLSGGGGGGGNSMNEAQMRQMARAMAAAPHAQGGAATGGSGAPTEGGATIFDAGEEEEDDDDGDDGVVVN